MPLCHYTWFSILQISIKKNKEFRKRAILPLSTDFPYLLNTHRNMKSLLQLLIKLNNSLYFIYYPLWVFISFMQPFINKSWNKPFNNRNKRIKIRPKRKMSPLTYLSNDAALITSVFKSSTLYRISIVPHRI